MMTCAPLDNERLLGRQQVLAITNVAYSTLWSWMRKGTFPRGLKIGATVKWRQSEIDEWLAALPPQKLKGDPEQPAPQATTRRRLKRKLKNV